MVFIGSQTTCNIQCILHYNKYKKYISLTRVTTYHPIITIKPNECNLVLVWAVGEESQRAGTAIMYREAVHSKWLPPLSLCVHFRKDFALKSGQYP